MDPDDAKQEIKQFIEDNPGCSIRDIIRSLNFDAELVIEIVDQIRKDGTIGTMTLE